MREEMVVEGRAGRAHKSEGVAQRNIRIIVEMWEGQGAYPPPPSPTFFK